CNEAEQERPRTAARDDSRLCSDLSGCSGVGRSLREALGLIRRSEIRSAALRIPALSAPGGRIMSARMATLSKLLHRHALIRTVKHFSADERSFSPFASRWWSCDCHAVASTNGAIRAPLNRSAGMAAILIIG